MIRGIAVTASVLAVLTASLAFGGTAIPPASFIHALLHPHAGDAAALILWQLRMPRVAVAATVGACLAIAGALLQGLLRNPLVDPYLTGTSAGAAAAIALAVTAGVAAPWLPFLGFVSGLASALLVALLARRGPGIDVQRLILAGVSLSALLGAIVATVLTRMRPDDASTQILAWLAGSTAGRGWHDLTFALPYAAAGIALAFAAAPALDALRAGEIRAASVGVDVARAQWTILAASSLLAAAAAALAGTIGFVGLIVPHLARHLAGSRAYVLLPSCALLGAALCSAADTVARSLVAPAELPLGVVLAFAGVPVFLVLYRRQEREFS